MPFRFLHLADVHLESRFGGRPATRERLRRAVREAFARALDLAVSERLHAVLVAGDLFDAEILSLPVELDLVRRVRELAEAGVWFLYAAGNHDPAAAGGAAARIFRDPALARVPAWRERVHFFDTRTPQAVVVCDARGGEVGVVVGAGHASAEESEDLLSRFHPVESALPLVALLHTQVESAQRASEHARYAPSAPRDYQRLPYAYFALGHVHLRQRAVPGAPAWYPGNLQGRNARETGAKGALLVDAEAGGHATPRFVPLAPVRWERVEVRDLAGVRTASELADRLAAEASRARASAREELVLRLDLAGASRAEPLVRDDAARAAIGEEVARRAEVLEVEIACDRLRAHDEDRAHLAGAGALSAAFDLLARAERDDALLAALAPDPLAGCDAHDDPAARATYLRARLAGLDGELARLARGEDGA